LHGGRNGATNVAGWDTGNPADSPAAGGARVAPSAVARRAARQAAAAQPAQPAPPPGQTQKPEERKGILHRLLGVFK
jgi:hypothetical protein